MTIRDCIDNDYLEILFRIYKTSKLHRELIISVYSIYSHYRDGEKRLNRIGDTGASQVVIRNGPSCVRSRDIVVVIGQRAMGRAPPVGDLPARGVEATLLHGDRYSDR